LGDRFASVNQRQRETRNAPPTPGRLSGLIYGETRDGSKREQGQSKKAGTRDQTSQADRQRVAAKQIPLS